jgi:NAD(P)-dependent dehydrogenase (short-subunit alcohol dehydrogenase family)
MGLRLNGKHALFTGAAGGIGLAVAQADLGRQVSAGLTELLAAYPERLQHIPTDVTQMAQIDVLVASALARFGPITTLFNNAAVFDMASLLKSVEAMCDKLLAVNVKGAFFVMQKVLAHMVGQQVRGGSVINMASQAGRRGEALVSHCCASKAAVTSYTQSAALAMAPHRIGVNGIAPGVIDTPMWVGVDALFARYEQLPVGEKKKRVGEAVPLGHMGAPGDIGRAAVFLASDEAAHITAQTLNVDGGNVMS